MTELQERLQAAVGDSYRIERELGGGGMSRVYLATEVALHRSVVIKLLAPELTSEVLAARFKRECEITATLGQHPHILPLLCIGSGGGLLYYVTLFIEGESLRHRLRRETRLALDDVVQILSELASALAYAHERGIVHRDLKPENVLLSGGHAILADFGISAVLSGHGERAPGGDDMMRLTDHGLAVGTPGYMCPEQASGDANIDGRADIYSLAVIGYEMLTGTPPFTGPTAMAVMTAHVNEQAKPVESLRTDTPEPLAHALSRAMEKQPADRYQTADEFRDALGVSYSGGRRSPLPRRRRGILVAAAVALAAVAVAAFAFVRKGETHALQDNLVAVAPFEALGNDLGVWREGLVDVLSSNLDGAGPLRTVPPSVVVRRAASHMDRKSAAELGRSTNAGITIYGSLIASGPDSVRASVTILETATGRTSELQYRDQRGRMDRVTDSLSLGILRELNRTRAIGATRRSAIGSSSLPALKAYLQGEQFYRRSDWDSAAVHYERAIALDPDFAPALRHLSNAMGWKLSPQLELVHEGYKYALMAGAKNHGLAPRESLLVAADSIFAALELGDGESTSKEHVAELIDRLTAMLDAGVKRFPDDPEMWYKLGDTHYHFTRLYFPSRSNTAIARAAFERSIALDSAFAPSYIHEVELAARDQDVGALRKSTRAFLSLDPHDVHGQSMRLIQAYLDPRTRRAINADSLIRASGPDVRQTVFGTMAPLMDSSETQVSMARSLYETARASNIPKLVAGGARTQVAATLMLRGHVSDALAFADSSQGWVFAEAGLLRAIHADSVARVLDPALRGQRSPQLAASGALFWAVTGDTTRLSALSRLVDGKKLPNFPLPMLRGLQALARRDTAGVISALTLPDSACMGWCWQARFPLALVLSGGKRDKEAAALLDQDLPQGTARHVLWTLERARVNERLGNRPKAVDAYAYVANAWRNADPVLKPYLDEARAALRRLSPDPGRA